MNVLILTPDRVGSTLLQRLITIYMVAHEYDRPVINLHELTNGLEISYSDVFNQLVLHKPKLGEWGYHQSLKEIVEKLSSVTHYKTSRLALYHLNYRKDPLEDRVRFYNYLNNNFYIISARRNNIFEHAISWMIVNHSKHLNVYTHDEKVEAFYNIYKNGLTVDRIQFVKHLNDYKKYIEWVDEHFNVNSYFEYEKHLKNMEEYILNLDIFPKKTRKTWNDVFGIEWSDWNKCHKLISDVGAVDIEQLEYNPTQSDSTSTELVLDKLKTNLSLLDQNYLLEHGLKYKEAYNGIQSLVDNGTLVTGVPIKLQTLAEKRKIIKNFDECVDVYNQWVTLTQMGSYYNDDQLKLIANEEVKDWYKEVPVSLQLK